MGTGLHPYRKAFFRHQSLRQAPYPSSDVTNRSQDRKDVPEIHRKNRKRQRPDSQGLLGDSAENVIAIQEIALNFQIFAW